MHCGESGRGWAERLPLLLFAISETVQDSLGFSPEELVFGHSVHGLFKLFSEQLLATKSMTKSIAEYVDTFCERMMQSHFLAIANLTSAQAAMKAQHDQHCVVCSFKPGELVLA